MYTQKQELVSIIIPTYKRPKMLGRAVQSVLMQTHKNIEIIIVDDNDEHSQFRRETERFMEQYKLNRKIKYVKHKANRGGAAARNTGVKIAEGTYVTFLDDDDEYLPEKIEKQLIKMLVNDIENLAVIYCQMDIYDKSKAIIGKTENYYKGNEEPFKRNMVKCIAGTPTILIKKRVFEEIGGFKKLSSGQDWYLVHEVLLKGYNIDYLDESLVKVNIHTEERISNNSTKIKSLKGEIIEIKRRYLNMLSKQYQHLVLYEHYMQLANHVKYMNKIEALGYFKKALKYKQINKRNFFFICSLFSNPKVNNKIKAFIFNKRI